MKFMNEVLKNKIDEFVIYQKNLIEKTKMQLIEAQDEYMKLMDLANSKDLEIEQLINNDQNQKNIIQSFEERLLSIIVLEYKIKNLDLENQKKVDKMKKHYDNTVNQFKSNEKYVITKMNHEKSVVNQIKMKEIDSRINVGKVKQLEKNNEKIRNKLNSIAESNNKEMKEKTIEIENLKENLNMIQKKMYHFQAAYPM